MMNAECGMMNAQRNFVFIHHPSLVFAFSQSSRLELMVRAGFENARGIAAAKINRVAAVSIGPLCFTGPFSKHFSYFKA